MNFNDGKPTKSALYLVDRGMQGRWYRYYNAETEQWGACGSDMNSALDGKDNYSTYEVVGFFPWVGPLTGPNFNPNKPMHEISQDDEPTVKTPKAKPVKMAKAISTPKVKVPKAPRQTHADGTVFYRADRGKWVAVYNGKQEAARPTAEACLAFLKKKYNVTGTVIPKE